MEIIWVFLDVLVFIGILLVPLVLTILFETFIAFLMGVDIRKNIKTIIKINSITNIPLNYILFDIRYGGLLTELLLSIFKLLIEFIPIFPIIDVFLEIIVVIIEYLLYKKWLKDFDKIGAFVILSNIFSYIFGILIPLIIDVL